MAMNRVQFQAGLSMPEFLQRYGTEEQCVAAVQTARWPHGFVCPECGGAASTSFVRGGLRYWQCAACRYQCSLLSGTLFAGTKLPLTRWFLALQLITQAKNNVAALELKRQLGVCYRTAWLLKHKIMEAMRLREDARELDGRVEIDDAYLGGERSGGKVGRGSENKIPIIAAVQTTPDGQPVRRLPAPATAYRGRGGGVRRSAPGDLGHCGLRWPVVLPGHANRRRRTRTGGHRRRSAKRQAAPVPGGQHPARQPEDRHRWHLPCVCVCQVQPSLPCRVPVPFQSPFQPAHHFQQVAPGIGGRPGVP